MLPGDSDWSLQSVSEACNSDGTSNLAAAMKRHEDEVYPLTFPPRQRSWDFWPAIALTCFLFSSMPISFVYLAQFAIFSTANDQAITYSQLLFITYSCMEVSFTLYQYFLAYGIQPASPPSTLSPEECLKTFKRAMQSGLGSNLSEVLDTASFDMESTLRKRNKATEALGEGIHGSLQGITRSPSVEITTLARNDPRAIEFRERLRNWFGRAPFEQITARDIRKWLSWACCNLPLEVAQKDHQKACLIERSAGMLESRTGWKFPKQAPSSGPRPKGVVDDKIKLMRLTVDPVNVIPRPLWWYVWLWVGEKLALKFIYASWGLKRYKEGELEYLLRMPKDWNPNHVLAKSDPIIFLHGLGFGSISFQNMAVVRKLCTTLSSHPVMIPIQPHIGQQIFDQNHLRPHSRKQFVQDVTRACRRWGFYDENGLTQYSKKNEGSGFRTGSQLDGQTRNGGVVLFSHSNGSVGHGWLLKDKPGMTKRNALVDPIVFCVWEGDVCYNFCYRQPYTGLEALLKYLIATELGIANTIQRHFDWSTNSLFLEDVPNVVEAEKTLFVLGGEDIIVDAKRVKRYLTRHGVRAGLQYDPTKSHSDGLRGSSLDRLMIWLATGNVVDVE